MTEHWTLGILIGLPLWSVMCIILFGLTVAAIVWEEGEAGLMFGISWLGALVIGAVLLFPYSADYHKWKPQTGTVAEVNKRLLSDGDKGMSEKFVVRFQGNDQEYGCEDTRCSLAKPNDVLNLSCIKEWQWAGTDGFNCKFVKRTPA